jgi:hypothetical protein
MAGASERENYQGRAFLGPFLHVDEIAVFAVVPFFEES